MKAIINPKYKSAESYIRFMPERFPNPMEGKIIDQRRNVIKIFSTDWGDWVVKAYKKPILFQRIVYSFFRKSKARRSYEYGFKFRQKGIDTPEPIAYIEQKENLLFSYGYFISKKCEDPEVYPYLENVEDYDKDLAREAAEFIAKIHDNGIMHGDVNLTNLLYHPLEESNLDDKKEIAKGRKFHFCVIDTNRSKFKRKLNVMAAMKDLRRLTYRRDLYEYMIHQYALARGLDPDKTMVMADKALASFKVRDKVKSFLNALIGKESTKPHQSVK